MTAAVLERLEWHEQARCRDAADPDKTFFPDRGETLQVAKQLCQACPVKDPCLMWALENEAYGIWGGTNEIERRRLRRQLGIRKKRFNA